MADSETITVADLSVKTANEFAREVAETATSLLDYALEGHRRGIKVYESLKNLNEVLRRSSRRRPTHLA